MTSPDLGTAFPTALPPAPVAAPQLTDRGAVALAVAVWVSALLHRPAPAILLVAVVLGAVLARRPIVVVVAAAVLAGTLASRAHAGLHPVQAGSYAGVVTLVGDPSPTAFGWRADVRLGHRHVELSAGDASGGALSAALAGERVRVEGRLAPPRPNSPWLVPRHVVGRLAATSVERVDAGAAPWRAANRFRRLLQDGAATMDEPARSLYAGFVLGDDRDQPPEIVDDFRGAGLTHLLVVSGEKVSSTLCCMTTRALIYTRVSEDRAGGRSPQEQEAEARAICERNDWTVSGVVTDSVGASRYSKGTRSGWKRAVAAVESKSVDVLVTWEASRAQRDLSAYVDLRDLCERNGVLWSYSGRTFDLADNTDRFTTGLDALLAEREAGEIAHRVQRAIRANALEGKPHGRRLFGYRRMYDPSTGALLGQEPEPAEAAVVARVFADYLAGRGPRTIARDLNAEGVTTAKGSGWKDVQIRRMLRTPAYAARRQHQGEVIGPADWAPIIDPEAFDRAQARLDEVRARNPRVRGDARLLSGVARCGVCGGKVACIHDRNKRKVYACREKFHVARDLLKLDAYVSDSIVEYLASGGGVPDDDERSDPALAAARLRVASLRQQLDDALDEFTAGNLSAATLGRIEQRLQPELQEAERAARRASVGLDLDVPAGGERAWWEGLDAEVKRQYVGELVECVTILPTKRGSRTFDYDAIVVEWRR